MRDRFASRRMAVTIEGGVILTGIGMIVIFGAAWGTVLTKLNAQALSIKRIEEMLGNGGPGMFVRRAEMDLIREQCRHEHGELERRLMTIEGENS